MSKSSKGIYKIPYQKGYYLFKLESFLATIEKTKYTVL